MKGLQSGAVIQRNRQNAGEVILHTERDETPVFFIGVVAKLAPYTYLYSDLPVGGPYTVLAEADGEEYTFTDIYVGDVWLLGGQSNMEGAGRMTSTDDVLTAHPDPLVRAFMMNDVWGPAVPLLNTKWNSRDPLIGGIFRKERDTSAWHPYDVPGEMPFHADRCGVGPGYAFAREMVRITGVPQAVIPCAVGGSSMNDWDPDATDRDTFFAYTLRRFRAAGGRVRGLYWDQGEADTAEACRARYVARMQHLVARFREVTGDPELPVVINQIAATTLPWITEKTSHTDWSAMRELQRRLPDAIDHCDIVPTLGAGMSDLIHKSSASQGEIGRAAALAMAHLCGMGGEPSVTFRGFRVYPDDYAPFRADLDVVYDHVVGGLSSAGEPLGVSLQLAGEEPPVFWPYIHIQNLELHGNVVTVHTENTPEELENACVWYGLGHNTVCTIRDAMGRKLPAMGPIAVKEHLLP